MISDETYDFLKWVAQDVLPGLATFYFALSSIWGFPYGEQVVGTISALDAFLSVVLRISAMNYAGDGTLVINTSDPDKDIYRLELEGFPEQLAAKDSITLKVKNPAHMKE